MTQFLERSFVWLGGALFVASLALAARWYVVRLARPVPFAGWGPIAVDGALFLLFAVHHSALARPATKALLSHVCPERLLRSVFVWTASLLLILVCVLWRPIGGEVYRTTGPLTGVHLTVQLAGLGLIVLSVRGIDALELAGIRFGLVGDLCVSGPFRFVRHPLYLGWMLMVFGPAVMTGDRLAFASTSSLYLVVAMPWEERSLEQRFGDAYRTYKEQVKWRVVPYIY
ncbi:MAG: hypothetical protein A3H97_11155 [Acidobacteria bacterium RIFCSPLOWO2_02_FULL_65_29]|nr:MAG: hypothetical protein A3H97_11155 [Acidobacteria bacterium RIFCSPLOWO2_02_FULL_65_29]